MRSVIFLDASPLSIACQRKGKSEAERCRTWIKNHVANGSIIAVAEITDYEVRRELIRSGNHNSIARLDRFIGTQPTEYIPISTAAIRKAAQLWARLWNEGNPTADPKELDCDVVLSAQMLTTQWSVDELIVATTNIRHLSRMVNADL